MEQTESPKKVAKWPFIGTAAAPIIVMTAFMLFSPWRHHPPDLDTGVYFKWSVLAGEVFVLCLPIKWYYKIFTFIVYFSVAWALLWFYTLFFDFIFLGSRLWKPA
jgi:hypothetical protein